MKVHVTYCPRCNKGFSNPEDRDYSKDICSQCRGPMEYKGTQEVKMIGIPNPTQKIEIGYKDDIFR